LHHGYRRQRHQRLRDHAATMQAMASKPTMFYSDDANGCSSPKQTLTGLIQIFGGLTAFFTAPRLLPDSTT
jgi:hypothetical protein